MYWSKLLNNKNRVLSCWYKPCVCFIFLSALTAYSFWAFLSDINWYNLVIGALSQSVLVATSQFVFYLCYILLCLSLQRTQPERSRDQSIWDLVQTFVFVETVLFPTKLALSIIQGTGKFLFLWKALHRAALITHQSLAAKLTLKYQIDFPAISTVFEWIFYSQHANVYECGPIHQCVTGLLWRQSEIQSHTFGSAADQSANPLNTLIPNLVISPLCPWIWRTRFRFRIKFRIRFWCQMKASSYLRGLMEERECGKEETKDW